MSVDINQESLRRFEALHRLGDALSDDILDTPAEKLIAEVAQDHGDGRAFVKTFNRMLTRAIRQSTWRRIVNGSIEVLAKTSSVVAWRPVVASIGAVLVVVVAGDLYLRWQQRGELETFARTPGGDRTWTSGATEPREDRERLALGSERSEWLKRPAAFESASVGRSVNAGRPPSPEEVAAPNSPKGAQGLVVRPNQTAAKTPVAAASPPPPHVAQAGPLSLAASNPPAVNQPAGLAERAGAERSNAAPASTLSAVPSFNWPVRGRVVAGFGPNPGRLRNDGINIAVPEGTDVRAADDGLVVYAGSDDKGYGNLVLLRHSNGFVTAYAHASALLVSLGDTVRRGQVIAKSGRSGNVAEPLVHFEIRKGTLPVDPVQYLPPD